MRTIVILILLIVSARLQGNTTAMPNLTKEALGGVWEAVVDDGSMAEAVYQMKVAPDGSATLLKYYARGFSKFFGRAERSKLADGRIKIRFTMDSAHVEYCQWIEVEGSAVGQGNGGAIVGKVTIHRDDPAGEWTEPVFFKKGLWIQDLASASRAAEKILQDPEVKDGHAMKRSR